MSYLSKLSELRSQLVFNPGLLDTITADLKGIIDDEITYGSPERFSCVCDYHIAKAERIIANLALKTKTFPARHLHNLKSAIENNHPEWRAKFDGILTTLGIGLIYVLGSTGFSV